MKIVSGLMIFTAGIAVGAGGTMLLMRKDYRKKLEEDRKNLEAERSGEGSEGASDGPNSGSEKGQKEEIPRKNEPEKNVFKVDPRVKKRTDAYGYTDYSDGTGAARRRFGGSDNQNEGDLGRIFADEQGIIEAKNVENEAQNSDSEDEIEENEYSDEELLGGICDEKGRFMCHFSNSKSGACATKSDTLDVFWAENDKIYGISDQDFFHSERDFEKHQLIFYAKNEVFTDDASLFVAHAPLLVGQKWRMEVGKYVENTAYVRNEKMGADYEIIVEDEAFETDEKYPFEEV